MSVDVLEEDGRYRPAVPFEGRELLCCEAGHAEAEEAARHAWSLSQAIARKATSNSPDGGNP